MTTMRARLTTWISGIGAALTAISCTVMIAATIVGFLGVIGVRASAGFADAFNSVLAPIAQPLLLGSLALIVIGMIPRGWLPIGLALLGGALIYLAMFISPLGAATTGDMSSMSSVAGMSTTSSDPIALAVFWLGIGVLAAGFVRAYKL